jgi:CBS-domain-containing membrane protein
MIMHMKAYMAVFGQDKPKVTSFKRNILRTFVSTGGATALIAAISVPKLPWAGFEFVIGILVGALAMLLVALIVNNWHRTVRYPTFWW